MRRTTAMEISQFTQARIQLSDVVCIYIYHGCRAIKSASGRAENYPPACGRTNAGTDPTTYALGKFWHANNYVGLHRYTIHGTVCPGYAAAHASEQTLPVNISGMASNTRGQLEQTTSQMFTRCDFVRGRKYWIHRMKYIFLNFFSNQYRFYSDVINICPLKKDDLLIEIKLRV